VGSELSKRQEESMGRKMPASRLAGIGLLLAVSCAVRAAEDCCTIVELDAKRQAITAVERGSGRLFTFSVKDPATFKSAALCERFDAPLREAQKEKPFAADFGSADPKKPCCTLGTEVGGAGQVLGVRPYEVGGVEVILTELRRTSGDSLTARWQYCNGGTQPVTFKAEGCVGMGCTYTLAENVELLDGETHTKHGVLRIEGREAVAERYQADRLRVGPNQILRTWAKFPAPPASSTKMTVVIPGASEPFEDVPIAK
jgi:hypothetical protein